MAVGVSFDKAHHNAAVDNLDLVRDGSDLFLISPKLSSRIERCSAIDASFTWSRDQELTTISASKGNEEAQPSCL